MDRPAGQAVPGPAADDVHRVRTRARPATEPHLSDMTPQGARPARPRRRNGGAQQGFFLQVEGASIDKQDHAENPCGQIGETIEFDNADPGRLEPGRKRTRTRSIIVTADHGHTSQIIEAQTDTDHSPGAIATLITADGQPMVVNYATNLPGRSQSHTGTEVRVAAEGPRRANVLGITDQTDLFHTMSRTLGLE